MYGDIVSGEGTFLVYALAGDHALLKISTCWCFAHDRVFGRGCVRCVQGFWGKEAYLPGREALEISVVLNFPAHQQSDVTNRLGKGALNSSDVAVMPWLQPIDGDAYSETGLRILCERCILNKYLRGGSYFT